MAVDSSTPAPAVTRCRLTVHFVRKIPPLTVEGISPMGAASRAWDAVTKGVRVDSRREGGSANDATYYGAVQIARVEVEEYAVEAAVPAPAPAKDSER